MLPLGHLCNPGAYQFQTGECECGRPGSTALPSDERPDGLRPTNRLQTLCSHCSFGIYEASSPRLVHHDLFCSSSIVLHLANPPLAGSCNRLNRTTEMLIRRLLHLYLLPWSISSVEGSTLTNHLAPRDYNSSHVDKYVGYVKDPNGRGTISLVLSCLLTLVLCVWSALHLNVPERNRKGVTTIWINFRWILAGIYSPEMVVFAAWRQWCSARMLNGHVQSLLEEQDAGRHDSNATGSAKGPQQCTVTWSMTHSFFACSGGFAVELQALSGVLVTETDDSPATDHENVRPARLTLTARGMMLLADSGHLPVVEKAEIEDKSKANDLAKAAVIVQATWMLIQVMSRLAARLPVTLLEVNTVAHV